mgnify:FL=1|tara:strand:+ start:113 stop:319 length:207 start_codon:yes stop_codon:yes gene_type:complete
MNPKEKAAELIGKMCGINCTEKNINRITYPALKAVDEIISLISGLRYYIKYDDDIKYWKNVKKEIENF